MTRDRTASSSPQSLARGLGWLSLAIGLAEVLAPRRIGRGVGLEERARLFRLCGLREIAVGLGLLCSERPEPWIKARIAGDLLDLGMLSGGLRRGRPRRCAAGVTLGVTAAITLLDLCCAEQLRARSQRADKRRDYSDRSGFPDIPERMRGLGRLF